MKPFKFEHRSQKVLPLPQFFARLGRYFLFAAILIIFSLGIGIAGYCFIGKLSFLDSFYMSSMILTGMGPVSEMTTAGAKIFSSIYALYSGIAFLSAVAVFFSPVFHRIIHLLHVEADSSDK